MTTDSYKRADLTTHLQTQNQTIYKQEKFSDTTHTSHQELTI